MPSFAYYASARCSNQLDVIIIIIFSYIVLIFCIILSLYNIVILSSLWSYYNELLYYVVIMSYYNQPLPGRGRPRRYKIGDQIEKCCKTISKIAQAEDKSTSQFQKWHKRSFYQGPGVKFPFSWEKITLPPGLLWFFLML